MSELITTELKLLFLPPAAIVNHVVHYGTIPFVSSFKIDLICLHPEELEEVLVEK
jgi:hypothetical protein